LSQKGELALLTSVNDSLNASRSDPVEKVAAEITGQMKCCYSRTSSSSLRRRLRVELDFLRAANDRLQRVVIAMRYL
jgi:hypothetical protein